LKGSARRAARLTSHCHRSALAIARLSLPYIIPVRWS